MFTICLEFEAELGDSILLTGWRVCLNNGVLLGRVWRGRKSAAHPEVPREQEKNSSVTSPKLAILAEKMAHV